MIKTDCRSHWDITRAARKLVFWSEQRLILRMVYRSPRMSAILVMADPKALKACLIRCPIAMTHQTPRVKVPPATIMALAGCGQTAGVLVAWKSDASADGGRERTPGTDYRPRYSLGKMTVKGRVNYVGDWDESNALCRILI